MIVMFLNSYKLESVKHMLSCDQKCIWKITWISVQVLQNSWNLKCVYFDRKVTSISYLVVIFLASLVAQRIKRLPAMQETRVRSLGWEDPLEKEMATHSSILAWSIPWTEETGRLQSTGLQRVGHNWATSHSYFSKQLFQRIRIQYFSKTLI